MSTTQEKAILSKNMINSSSSYETHVSQLGVSNYPVVRRPLVYVTRRIPQAGLSALLEVCNVKQWDSELVAPKGEILANVVGVDGILCLPSDVIGAEVLDAAGPQLHVVATISCDSKHVDVQECHRRGIQVVTCCFRPTEILAELTIALVLLTIKESQTEEDRLSLCGIRPPDLISSDPDCLLWTTKSKHLFLKSLIAEELSFEFVNGKSRNTESLTWTKIAKMTFGVYGQTKLGKRVAKILRNIGIFNVLVSDLDKENTFAKEGISQDGCRIVSLGDLLQNSDVICVCGSESENSNQLFSRETFEKMKKRAILIVSQSQEKAVKYTDLYMALRDGRIKAAGLNDCNQKPVPYKALFMGLGNCTFLPQSQESVCDIRDKVSVDISKSLIHELNVKRRQQTED